MIEAKKTLPIVCICGSTRFADQHAIARWELEKEGDHICLMINYLPAGWAEDQGWNGNDHFGEITGRKDALDELHMRKIDLADWVLVIAPEGYIGESTQAEIDYARFLGKRVWFVCSATGARTAAASQANKFGTSANCRSCGKVRSAIEDGECVDCRH